MTTFCLFQSSVFEKFPSVNLQPKKWRFPELAENELGECRRETLELGECARTRGMRRSKSGKRKGQGDFGTRGSAFGSPIMTKVEARRRRRREVRCTHARSLCLSSELGTQSMWLRSLVAWGC